MSKNPIGKCALCRQNKELRLSHIIPHFVKVWLENNSPGKLRNSSLPNKPVQDLDKCRLLCHDCEELFSFDEKYFSETIFTPYLDFKKTKFDYNESLTRFIISLSWRTLYVELEGLAQNFSSIPYETRITLFHAEQVMRDYLLGKRNDIGTIENHIFFFNSVQHTNNPIFSQQFQYLLNTTTHGSTASYITFSNKSVYAYANLAGILIITFFSTNPEDKWINTKIELPNGTISAEKQEMVSDVMGEIERNVLYIGNTNKELSDIQKEKIRNRIQACGDEIKKFPIYQDWMADITLNYDLNEPYKKSNTD